MYQNGLMKGKSGEHALPDSRKYTPHRPLMYWRVRACSRQVAYTNALQDMARHMVQKHP